MYGKNSDFYALQDDLQSVLEWAAKNQLGIAFHKSNVLHMGKNNGHFQYKVDNSVIPAAKCVKDLGVYVSDDLNFSVHVDRIVAKAHRMGALVYRSFKCRDRNFLVQMFVTFVRPMLEYNTTVWSPYQLVQIKKLERVQRRFSKRIPGLQDTPYLDRLKILGLERLELRRIRFDLVMAFKIVKGLNGLVFGDFF